MKPPFTSESQRTPRFEIHEVRSSISEQLPTSGNVQTQRLLWVNTAQQAGVIKHLMSI